MNDVILAPIITEKSMQMVKKGKYTFKVAKNTDKGKIKKAIKEKFNVDVVSVATINVKAKKKNVQRYKYEVPAFKKAIVKLKPEQKIDLFELGGKKYMKLKFIRKKHSGRDSSGKVTVRHQGAEQKRYMRVIDFKRDKREIPAKVVAFEYDPNRTVDLALVQYTDGEKRYILRPEGLKLNDSVMSGENVDQKVGNATPLSKLTIGTVVHNVELTPGRGGQLGRSAGTSVTVAAQEGGYSHLKLPSGEIRKVKAKGYATMGMLGNLDWKNFVFKKAGTKRHMGIRPTVRGTAQNPRSHPHGGGEGRSGKGMATPKTYAGRPAVGKTRNKTKWSNKYILQRRKGKR